jgi:anti-anti-sigma factor
VDRPTTDQLSCRALRGGRSQRIVVTGEIDLAGADDLARFLDVRIAAAAPGDRIRVDLAGVLFCAAVGVRTLVGAARQARDLGVTLTYQPHSPAVALALDICGHLALTGAAPASEGAVARLRVAADRAGDRPDGTPTA